MNKPAGTPMLVRCAGCGYEFEYVHVKGTYRKWCSDACAKAFGKGRGRVCTQCGRPTVRPVDQEAGEQLCRRCAGLRFGQRLEELWARGLTARQIAAEVGWHAAEPNVLISIWRAKGFDLPHRRPQTVVDAGRRLTAKRLASATERSEVR